MRVTFKGALLGAFVTIFAACDDSTGPETGALFKVEVSGESFVVHVETKAQIDALESRRTSGSPGVIIGELVKGDGGFNKSWGWHLKAASVQTADMAIEVCDGRPSMVQKDLTYWLDTVKQFCPWGAKVVQRIQ